MNIQQAMTSVYNFRTLDSGYESAPVSCFKATRQAVRDIFGGDLIEATEELVPQDEVDEMGRYRRVATGWGELG